jgi:hypothetical protein
MNDILLYISIGIKIAILLILIVIILFSVKTIETFNRQQQRNPRLIKIK